MTNQIERSLEKICRLTSAMTLTTLTAFPEGTEVRGGKTNETQLGREILHLADYKTVVCFTSSWIKKSCINASVSSLRGVVSVPQSTALEVLYQYLSQQSQRCDISTCLQS